MCCPWPEFCRGMVCSSRSRACSALCACRCFCVKSQFCALLTAIEPSNSMCVHRNSDDCQRKAGCGKSETRVSMSREVACSPARGPKTDRKKTIWNQINTNTTAALVATYKMQHQVNHSSRTRNHASVRSHIGWDPAEPLTPPAASLAETHPAALAPSTAGRSQCSPLPPLGSLRWPGRGRSGSRARGGWRSPQAGRQRTGYEPHSAYLILTSSSCPG